MAKTSSIFSIGDEEAAEALEEDFLLDFDDGKGQLAPKAPKDDTIKQLIKTSDQSAIGDAKFKFKTNPAANSVLKIRTESNIGAKNGFHGHTSAASVQFKSSLLKESNSSVNRKNYLSGLGNLCNKSTGVTSTQNGNHSASGSKNVGFIRSDFQPPSLTSMPTPLNSRIPTPQEGQEKSCAIPKESGLSSMKESRGLTSNQFHPTVQTPQNSGNSFQKYQPTSCQSQFQRHGSDKLRDGSSAAYESGDQKECPKKLGNENNSSHGEVMSTLRVPISMPIEQKQVPTVVGMDGQSVLSSHGPSASTFGPFKKNSQFASNKDVTTASPGNVNCRSGRISSPNEKQDAKQDSNHVAEQVPGKSPSNNNDKHTTSSCNPGLRAIPNLQSRVSSGGQFQKKSSAETLTPRPQPASSHQGSSSFIPAVRPSTPSNNVPFSQFQKRNLSDTNRFHTPPRHPGVSHWNSPRPLHGPSYHGQRYNGSTRMRMPQVPPGDQFPSPQAPVLTPRVAQLCKTPTGSSTSSTTRSTRKFPGPAGILPKLTPGQSLSNISLSPPAEEETERNEKEGTTLSSQDSTFDDFSQGAWATMKMEMEFDEKNPKSILAQHNIASVLRRASMRQLQRNKVPHICVMIKLISIHTHDAAVTFKDPTGEMQGTLHRQLLEEYQSDLKPGCVLLLKQVGVLSPSLRNHYLNVTHRNVVQIFPSQHTSSQKSPTSQPSNRSSPKSIKVNKDEFQGNSASPELAEGRINFNTKRREENIDRQGTHSGSFVSRTEVVAASSLEDRGQDDTSGRFQKKRTSDESIEKRTKRQCLMNREEKGTEKENVSPNKEGRCNGFDTSSSEHVIPDEESIAELIDGFEDELFSDF